MKIRQTLQHMAAKQSLTLPWVGEKVRAKLVSFHVDHFLDRAPEKARSARIKRLEAFFDATMDAYLEALESGFTEAKAREVTHIQANMEFLRMGWIEMMEIPPDEVPTNMRRYEAFFQDHGITLENPLGSFEPEEGLPSAPATSDGQAKAPYAERGYAEATYVEDDEGNLRREP